MHVCACFCVVRVNACCAAGYPQHRMHFCSCIVVHVCVYSFVHGFSCVRLVAVFIQAIFVHINSDCVRFSSLYRPFSFCASHHGKRIRCSPPAFEENRQRSSWQPRGFAAFGAGRAVGAALQPRAVGRVAMHRRDFDGHGGDGGRWLPRAFFPADLGWYASKRSRFVGSF